MSNNNITHAILSLAINDSEILAEVATELDQSMFSGLEQKAFSLMKNHFDRGLSVDAHVFQQEMLRSGGSKAFVDSILSFSASPTNLNSYIEAFKLNVCATKAMFLKSKIDQAITNATNKDDLLADLSREFDAVTNVQGISSNDVISISDYLPTYTEENAKIAESEGPLGLPSGLREYDRMTSGLVSTDLIVLAGRPAMGKTSMALSLLFDALKKGSNGFFVSLEMPKKQIVDRLISMYSGIPLQNVRQANLSQRQQSAYEDSLNFIKNVNLQCSDKGGLTFSEIRRKAITLHNKKPLDFLIIDYLQLINLRDTDGNNKSEKLGEVTAGLKTLAKDLNIPIILLSQLSRECEQRADKRPMPSDLRESGAIEQDADIILFVYRDVVYNEDTKEPNKAELIIAKQRNGATGTVYMDFKANQTMFTNYLVA